MASKRARAPAGGAYRRAHEATAMPWVAARPGDGWPGSSRGGTRPLGSRVTARFVLVLVRWLTSPASRHAPVRIAGGLPAAGPALRGSRLAAAGVPCGPRLPLRLTCDEHGSRQRSAAVWPDVGQTNWEWPRRPLRDPRERHQSCQRAQLGPRESTVGASGRRRSSAKPRARVRAQVLMSSKGAGNKLTAGERLKWTPEEVSRPLGPSCTPHRLEHKRALGAASFATCEVGRCNRGVGTGGGGMLRGDRPAKPSPPRCKPVCFGGPVPPPASSRTRRDAGASRRRVGPSVGCGRGCSRFASVPATVFNRGV